MTTRGALLIAAVCVVLNAGCEPLFEDADGAAQASAPRTTATPMATAPAQREEVSRGRDRTLSARQLAAVNKARTNVSDGEIMRQLANTAERIAQNLATGAPAPVPATINPGSNRALGYRLMTEFGWPADQWPALDALWHRESGWNQYAENGSSGAYGIPQSLPGNKMAAVGADWKTNPETQIRWGLAYIGARYGNPKAAWAHSEKFGWY